MMWVLIAGQLNRRNNSNYFFFREHSDDFDCSNKAIIKKPESDFLQTI